MKNTPSKNQESDSMVHFLVESLDGSVYTEMGEDEEGRAVVRVYDKQFNLIDMLYEE